MALSPDLVLLIRKQREIPLCLGTRTVSLEIPKCYNKSHLTQEKEPLFQVSNCTIIYRIIPTWSGGEVLPAQSWPRRKQGWKKLVVTSLCLGLCWKELSGLCGAKYRGECCHLLCLGTWCGGFFCCFGVRVTAVCWSPSCAGFLRYIVCVPHVLFFYGVSIAERKW